MVATYVAPLSILNPVLPQRCEIGSLPTVQYLQLQECLATIAGTDDAHIAALLLSVTTNA